MNKVPFTEATSFPLDSTALQNMQDNCNLVGRAVAQFFGTNVIVSGVEESGDMLTDGVIILGGEILTFKSSPKASYFKITETKHETTTPEGKFTVLYERYATAVSEATAYVRANITRANYFNKLDKSVYDEAHSMYKVIIPLKAIAGATFDNAELEYIRSGDVATCNITITNLTTSSSSATFIFTDVDVSIVHLPGRLTGIGRIGTLQKTGSVRSFVAKTSYNNGFVFSLGSAAANETLSLSYTSIIG